MIQTIITFIIIGGACFWAGLKLYRYAIDKKHTSSQCCNADNLSGGCSQCSASNCQLKGSDKCNIEARLNNLNYRNRPIR